MASLRGGPVSTLPVPGRSVPFDVDLGPDVDGNVVAVYSRCRVEPSRGGGFREVQTRLPAYGLGQGCDLFRYRLGEHAERRLRHLSDPGASEYLPSVWRDTVAFARREERGRGRPTPGRVLVRTLDGTGRTMRARGGKLHYDELSGDNLGPVAIELFGRRLAYVWDTIGQECRSPGVDFKYDPVTSELWLEDIGRLGTAKPQGVSRGCSTDPTVRLQSPSFAAGRLHYVARVRETQAGSGSELRSRLIRGGATTRMVAPPCLASMVVDARTLYASRRVPCPGLEDRRPPRYQVTRTAH